jgi:hypothetical protein
MVKRKKEKEEVNEAGINILFLRKREGFLWLIFGSSFGFRWSDL